MNAFALAVPEQEGVVVDCMFSLVCRSYVLRD